MAYFQFSPLPLFTALQIFQHRFLHITRSLTGKEEADGTPINKDGKPSEDGAASSSSSDELVPSSPELRYREVLAVPLPRRPLFPGGIIPVTVHNPALVQELATLKRQGYVIVCCLLSFLLEVFHR